MSAGLAHLQAELVRNHGCACVTCQELIDAAVHMNADDGRHWLRHTVSRVLDHGCVCAECDRWLAASYSQRIEEWVS